MSVSHPLLSRSPQRDGPVLPLLSDAPDLALALGRVHEACGPARHRLALWLAHNCTGPVIWIAPDWSTDRLNPCGMQHIVDPARLIFVHPRRADDILWSMEEALRAGLVSLVVADLPGLPGLTPVRRLHLAAETGAQEGAGTTPLGLLLTPGQGGAQGVETRWHLAPDHCQTPGHWRLERLRARTAPQAVWRLGQRAGKSLPDRISDRIQSLTPP